MAYLVCECGSMNFIPVNKLKQTMAGGVVPEVNGYICANGECMEKVDTGRLLKNIELKKKAQELKNLTEELKADAAEAKPQPKPIEPKETGPAAA